MASVQDKLLKWADKRVTPWSANDATRALKNCHRASVHARVCELAREGSIIVVGSRGKTPYKERLYKLLPKGMPKSPPRKIKNPGSLLENYRRAVETRNASLEKSLKSKLLELLRKGWED